MYTADGMVTQVQLLTVIHKDQALLRETLRKRLTFQNLKTLLLTAVDWSLCNFFMHVFLHSHQNFLCCRKTILVSGSGGQYLKLK